MRTQESLLESLATATAEFGSNSALVVKLRTLIGQHFPAAKDVAHRTASTGKIPEAPTTEYNGRIPINLGNIGNRLITPKPENVVGSKSVPNESEILGAEDNKPSLTEEALASAVNLSASELLATYGRDEIQATAVRLGFTTHIKKKDDAYAQAFLVELKAALDA